MKRILNITLAAAAGLLMASCNLNYFPSDELSPEVLLADKQGAQYMMDGCYSMLKDEVEHLGYASGNTYVRHYFQMAEFPSDNICLSGRTTDPLYEATVFSCTDGLKNIGTLWWLSYKVIFTANSVLEGFKEGVDDATDQLLGEAYFIRALMHFNLLNLYAKPYAQGRDNLGVVLRLSTNTNQTSRAKVGECYDAVVADLIKAGSLMGASRGNNGYPCKDAAFGLLSRVYLYMGENQKVVDVIKNDMGVANAAAAAGKLDKNFESFFANALTSKEALFCIGHVDGVLEDRGTSSIGSMYNKDTELDGGEGWGEVYCSDPLLNLYERYPSDVRYTAYIAPQYAASGKDIVTFPIESAADNFRSNLNGEVKSDAQGKYAVIEGATCRISEKIVNGEYKEYEIDYKGTKCPARLSKAMITRNTYPNYFVRRFGYQGGRPQLSSPVIVRWGEVVLNLAEAQAKLGNNADALALVDVMRTRAGIPAEGLFSSNMHGYSSVLDIVLDERRMEMAFEGHRLFDQVRNNLPIDRRYAGVQKWELVQPTYEKIQYPIPFEEYSVSGIQQNPSY